MSELVDQDGFVHNLFFYLWKKDPLLKLVPNISIPDTIIYQSGEMLIWYFSGENQVKRKSRNKMNNEYLIDKFLQNKPNSGIIACWITQIKQVKSQEEKLIYQYLTEREFLDFVNDKNKVAKHGILQKFIQPKGDNNFIIKATWAKQLCFFEKVQNKNKINQLNMDVYQRVLTFENSDDGVNVEQLKGSYLPLKLDTTCNNIYQHISNVSGDRFKILRMILIFKIDINDKIWLLNCSSIRVQDSKLTLLEKVKYDSTLMNMKIGIPEYIDKTKINIHQPQNLRLNSKCGNCGKNTEENMLCEITFRYIIQSWEFDHNGEKQKQMKKDISPFGTIPSQELFQQNQQLVKQQRRVVDNDNNYQRLQSPHHTQDQLVNMQSTYQIPSIIRNIMPKLKPQKYLLIKNNPSFLDRSASVCEECYLNLLSNCNTQENLEQLKKQSEKISKLDGIGKLKPEILANRYNKTRKHVELKHLIEDYINKQCTNNQLLRLFNTSQPGEFKNSSQIDFEIKSQENQKRDMLSKVGLKFGFQSEKNLNRLTNKMPQLMYKECDIAKRQKSKPDLTTYKDDKNEVISYCKSTSHGRTQSTPFYIPAKENNIQIQHNLYIKNINKSKQKVNYSFQVSNNSINQIKCSQSEVQTIAGCTFDEKKLSSSNISTTAFSFLNQKDYSQLSFNLPPTLSNGGGRLAQRRFASLHDLYQIQQQKDILQNIKNPKQKYLQDMLGNANIQNPYLSLIDQNSHN